MLKVEHFYQTWDPKKAPGAAIRSKYISLKKIDLVIAGPQCSFKKGIVLANVVQMEQLVALCGPSVRW